MQAADLDRLRARVAALEGRRHDGGRVPDGIATGVAAIDAVLPGGGITTGDVHEVTAAGTADTAAATAFAALLAVRRLATDRRALLWIVAGRPPHAPALAALGLTPERMVVVMPRRPAQTLWALEEALRSPAIAAIVAQAHAVTPVETRRLHLAARDGGGLAIILNGGPALPGAGTRWRVASQSSTAPPGLGVGAARWRLDLMHCRGRCVGDDGTVATWDVEWNEQTHRLCLAAPSGDREIAPVRRRAAG